ncbi:MAG: Asp-tRNA(Asn)/Glu-tRNA(Gln) amidotransferase subunit GatA [Proteobacteria bacterium]|nr:Asp-tRNA(Asn)/Glu-tRNA(Gln) amidotransferase subunit GatA [Pseudomonadota bacterium]
MTDLTKLTIAKAKQKLTKKEISATELMQAHIKSINDNKDLNAFITMTTDQALQQAKIADHRLKDGEARPLEGIPTAVKDLFCTKKVRTTAGSAILDGFIPPYESTVTSKLFENGAIMVGKTNMDEFAMGSSNTTSYYGNVINPLRGKANKDLVPGGSSGGSAAAVAGYMAMGSLGSDTGGSIRQPAAFCGIVGIKPTYGRCSRYGMVAFASSLDQAGVFTRTVEDSALLLSAICGYDSYDSTSASAPIPNWQDALHKSVKGLRIGIPKEYIVDGMNSELTALWQRAARLLQDMGATIVDISLPHTKYALPAYYVIAPAEASSNLMRYDGIRYGFRTTEAIDDLSELYRKTRAQGFGAEVKRRIMIGTYVLSAGYHDDYYLKAKKIQRLIREDFSKAYAKVDAILTPTTPTTAFAIGEKMDDPVAMYLNDVFTVPASIAGLPGISIPAMLAADGLPLGLQVLGKPFDESTVFTVAKQLEEALAYKSPI